MVLAQVKLLGVVVVASALLCAPAMAQTATQATGSGGGVYKGSNAGSAASGSAASGGAASGGVYNSGGNKSGASPVFTKKETAGALPSPVATGRSYGIKSATVTSPDADKINEENKRAKAEQAQKNAAERNARAAQIKAQFDAEMARTQKQNAAETAAIAAGSASSGAQKPATNPADPYNGAKVTFENPAAAKNTGPKKLFNTSR